MEYYNGIMFLTTNRPGVIDEAIKSRVHMSLQYTALTDEQTLAIFRQNITQLRSIEQKRAAALGVTEMDIFEKDILAWAKNHYDKNSSIGRWNGRQIRNAFSIAASLAHFEVQDTPGRAVQLRDLHFQRVEDATLEYDKYRESVLNGTDDEIAMANESRNDRFGERQTTAPQATHPPPPKVPLSASVARWNTPAGNLASPARHPAQQQQQVYLQTAQRAPPSPAFSNISPHTPSSANTHLTAASTTPSYYAEGHYSAADNHPARSDGFAQQQRGH